MVKDFHWDNERLAALTLDALKTVRANAVRLEKLELVLLCDAELARRSLLRNGPRRQVFPTMEKWLEDFTLFASTTMEYR